MTEHSLEVAAGRRFEFGGNWARFLESVDDRRIDTAMRSLLESLEHSSLEGLTFLDAGCGSGLFSLAARRLGATVRSFDYDPISAACARELKRRYRPDDAGWTIEEGSVLDAAYLRGLGTFDIVYSWGVLHHTGEMWTAIRNVSSLAGPNGILFISLYNDQGVASRVWAGVKAIYNRLPGALKWLVLVPAALRLWGPTIGRDALSGEPLASWRRYGAERGMTPWRDVVDWVGGYPFEVASPGDVLRFCEQLGFASKRLKSVGSGLGCNEYVLERRAP